MQERVCLGKAKINCPSISFYYKLPENIISASDHNVMSLGYLTIVTSELGPSCSSIYNETHRELSIKKLSSSVAFAIISVIVLSKFLNRCINTCFVETFHLNNHELLNRADKTSLT